MHHMDCECTCVCVLPGGDPGNPESSCRSGPRRIWKLPSNPGTHHHPLSAGIAWELMPMTCWAMVRADSARRSFLTLWSR
jgi:hypothetical protein